jgi:electron transfer flavoprotein beta subunit
MKLLVCIKQVPDMESKFKIDSDGLWYDRSDLAWRMNEYDEYGVEQAVRVKEQSGGDLTVLCIGPDRVKETMKKALAMGCDRGVHLVDDHVHRRDPLAIAHHIADFARDMGFDLIFCGMQSQDRGSGQVGPMVAELLGMTAVTTVVDFVLDGRIVTVKRELEGGVKMVVRTALPALVTCQLGLNTPRYPTLPNIMKAKKKELLTIPVATTVAPAIETMRMGLPEKKGGGLFLEGDAGEIAERLIKILREKTGLPA